MTTTPATRVDALERLTLPDAAPRRPVPARLAEGVVLLAVVLLAIEATTRIEDRIRYGTPIGSGFTDQSELIVRDAAGIHGRPHARYRKFVLNNYGFRGPDITPAPADGARRVLVVGASESFGLQESPGKEYPRQLEDSLAARGDALRAAGIGRVEVVNAAMLGMTLPTVIQQLQRNLAPLGPALVVAYPTPVQYLMDARPVAAAIDSTAVAPPEPSPLRPRLAPRLRDQVKLLLPPRLARALRARDIDRAVAAHPPGWVFEAVPEDRLAAYEADLRTLVGTVRGIGAVPVLMSHVNVFDGSVPPDEDLLTAWRRFYPRATGPVLLEFERRARLATCRVAADSAVPVLDLDAHFTPPRGRWIADYSHFTDAGAGLVAGRLADVVTGVLAPAPRYATETTCARP